MNRGMVYALSSYLLWGFLPIYWKFLTGLPALETTAHRIVWSAVFAGCILAAKNHWNWLAPSIRRPQIIISVTLAALLILFNWLIYIVAVNSNRIVESSLGYYMNPLVNVLLAVTFLRERPRLGQWLAIGLAAAGVLYMTITYGRLPWIALALAFSFAFYALLKKRANLPALEGLFLEMMLLAIPLGAYLLYLEAAGQGNFAHLDSRTTVLLTLAGVVTGLPLLLFSAGAKQVPLTVLGLLQYVAPTIQFILGIWLYREPFSTNQLIGFAFIWTALLLYSLEGFMERRRLSLALRPH
jgi:chloramphenicol-sensitive protein RarD